jgi:hypothetical protein
MSFDEQDKEYLKKLVEKRLAQHDGKVPIIQLDPVNLKKWDAVNAQGYTLNKPGNEDTTLALYLIDVDNQAVKRFTVTKNVLFLLGRRTAGIGYGTTGKDGHQYKVVLQWEKEMRM